MPSKPILLKSTDGESMLWLARYVNPFYTNRPTPFSLTGGTHPHISDEKLTSHVPQACFGGMLFGIETGIIGGVLTLKPFKEYVGQLPPT
jgi:hypothetical protein